MTRKIGLLKGDGIGPEITDSMVQVWEALQMDVEWIPVVSGEEGIQQFDSAMPQESQDLIRELGIAIKGPTATPIGTGHKSANVTLRKKLDLYANVRPCFRLEGVDVPFNNVDLIIIRENTEDVYSAIEHRVSPDTAQCLKVITKPGSERIARFAFEHAKKLGRKKVTCVHKANIMKITDGMFLEVFREVAKDYPDIEADDMIVDAVCMQLVRNPGRFDVMVTQNLYGDILSDLCAGLVGGLGLAGGANIGKEVAVFEAVHGTAPDIAGKNLANPTAMLLSSLMMLDYMGLHEPAQRLKAALNAVCAEGKHLTGDLGGKATTTEYTKALIEKIKA